MPSRYKVLHHDAIDTKLFLASITTGPYLILKMDDDGIDNFKRFTDVVVLYTHVVDTAPLTGYIVARNALGDHVLDGFCVSIINAGDVVVIKD